MSSGKNVAGRPAGLEASMKIAVIGTGHIGGTLGQRWRAAGHEVVYGSRAESGTGPGGAPVLPADDAVTGADVVVLAVPGGAAAPGAAYVRAFNTLGWENFADPPPGAVLFFAADPGARPLAEELITAVGLEPVFAGDADACATVDALLPLWFALVQQNGGNRRVALRITP